jgi:hypothetical protein
MTTHAPLYRKIKLTQGKYVLVDAADFDWLNQWKWQAMLEPTTGNFYAKRGICVEPGKFRHIPMHRQILGLQFGDPRTGDHVNTKRTLDNRRKNLRIATRAEQNRNKGKKKDNTSGYKGVTRHGNYWRAQISSDGKHIVLGQRKSPYRAHLLYRKAVKAMHGEFANTGRKNAA